jgi:hypothetical protein
VEKRTHEGRLEKGSSQECRRGERENSRSKDSQQEKAEKEKIAFRFRSEWRTAFQQQKQALNHGWIVPVLCHDVAE